MPSRFHMTPSSFPCPLSRSRPCHQGPMGPPPPPPAHKGRRCVCGAHLQSIRQILHVRWMINARPAPCSLASVPRSQLLRSLPLSVQTLPRWLPFRRGRTEASQGLEKGASGGGKGGNQAKGVARQGRQRRGGADSAESFLCLEGTCRPSSHLPLGMVVGGHVGMVGGVLRESMQILFFADDALARSAEDTRRHSTTFTPHRPPPWRSSLHQMWRRGQPRRHRRPCM